MRNVNPAQSLDLKAHQEAKVRREAAEAVARQREFDADMAETMANAVAWDRAMTRAFKGIVSAPARHASLGRKSMYDLKREAAAA